MKYTADKIAPVLKNNLAIIKRIDEVPGWEKKIRQKQQVEKEKQPVEDAFENWTMPPEEEGYIRANSNDFL